jgi:A/G-specific adenine glycosylase
MGNQKLFTRLLLQWKEDVNKRIMPWKGEKDPYKVWLSEVILQQTRVEQGWNYYEKFISAYPTIKLLANAKDEDVFKLWEGLGYYSRCRNLLHTARIIAEKYNGHFPHDYNSILNLKGIGSYTASAIASFCFELPHAVVDGNVLRVLARYFGIGTPADTTEGRAIFAGLAQQYLDKKQPGEYNQAIMDFGATICKPAPLCNECPLQKKCLAFKLEKVFELPMKTRQLEKKERWFSYFVFMLNDKKFVRQRAQKDIWQHLHEFYLTETLNDPGWSRQSIQHWLAEELAIEASASICIFPAKPQVLTHQIIKGSFIGVELFSVPETLKIKTGQWLSEAEISKKAFPRFIHQYLSEKPLLSQVFSF